MRKNVNRVLAVGLTAVLTAGLLAGNVEYASHTYAIEAQAAQKVTREQVESKESGGLDSTDVSKQETVYVNLDATGQKKDVVVSDWLKNSGTNGAVKDVSDLEDIENVKGEEEFTRDGDSLTWQTQDQDIYYQGKTEKDLPIGITFSYRLDGKDVEPQDILGKDGKLEITIHYTNTSSQAVSLDGEETTLYTPFAMVTGMILPVDIFKNVTIDHGTIVSEGDNDFVVGYGLPGLSESLDLENLDFGEDVDIDSSKIQEKITDTVTITADVTGFEMKSTYTVATNQIFNELDFDEMKDLDELNDKIDQLTDASTQLVDGSSDLQDGIDTLNNSFEEYAQGVQDARDGSKELKDGAAKLESGVNSYTKGTDKLLGGVDTYVKGTKTLSNGVLAYTAGTSQLVDAINQLQTGVQNLPAQYDTLSQGIDSYISSVNTLLSQDNMTKMSQGAASIKEGVGQLNQGLKSASKGVSSLNAAAGQLKETEELTQCVAGLTALYNQYEQAAGNGDEQAAQAAAALKGAIAYIQGGEQAAAAIDAATNGKADGDLDSNGSADLAVALAAMETSTDSTSQSTNLYTGAAALESSISTMSGYASQIRDGSASLTQGDAQMKAGISQLTGSIGQIDTAAGTLTENNESLDTGAKKLIKSGSKITKNTKKLTKNSSSLRKGAGDLEQGSDKLFAGMTKLISATGEVSQGISDINDGAIELKDGMADFDRDGVNEVAKAVTQLLDTTDNLNNRLSKISSLSENYTTFSGNTESMDGSVKFVMSTEGVRLDDED
jgi:putative membrane protein